MYTDEMRQDAREMAKKIFCELYRRHPENELPDMVNHSVMEAKAFIEHMQEEGLYYTEEKDVEEYNNTKCFLTQQVLKVFGLRVRNVVYSETDQKYPTVADLIRLGQETVYGFRSIGKSNITKIELAFAINHVWWNTNLEKYGL